MKNLLILIALLISISSIAQDMQKYLTETKEMVQQKKYQEANERYEWFQNHALEYDAAMVGVRSSFALSYWKSLADIYPPAMAAMKEMRDKKTNQLIDSIASVKLFSDVASLNRELNEEQKTISLFEKIDSTDHNKASKCFHYAKNALFNAKRYDILRNFIGNPMNEFQEIKDERSLLFRPYKSDDTYAVNMRKRYADNNFVEKTLRLIKFTLAVDDYESAKKIKSEAIQIVNDNRLRDIEMLKEKS